MSDNKDIWVIFDGFGVQVFFTEEEKYANFSDMSDEEYNKAKCSIAKNVPNFTGLGRQQCVKDMTSGNISVIERPRDWKPVHPHIPA